MARTINDMISSKLAPVMRRISDLNVALMGTEASVLRITHTEADLFGQSEESLEATIIDNVVIQYPSGDKRIHTATDTTAGINETESFDLWDILPITMIVPFEGPTKTATTDYVSTPIALEVGDVIVHVWFDEHLNKIPIIMKVSKLIGSFMTRFLVSKKYTLTLYRGTLPTAMDVQIQNYIDNLTFD